MGKRVVLITGCSQPDSLGVSLAVSLQVRGSYEVYVTARNVDSDGIQVATRVGCKALALDVTSSSSVDDAVGTLAKETGGRLDILINNAAVWGRCTTLDVDIDSLKSTFETNVFGPVRVIQACAPLMLAAKAPQKPMIVNIGSQAASGIPWQAAYSSSKAAFNTVSDVLGIETKGLGIEVLTVIAGSFRTHNMDLTIHEPLPPSHFYPTIGAVSKAVLEAFKKISQSAPTVETVSASIVDRIESGKGGRMYNGAGAFAARYVLGYLPHRLFGRIIGDMFGAKLVQAPSADQLEASTVWTP